MMLHATQMTLQAEKMLAWEKLQESRAIAEALQAQLNLSQVRVPEGMQAAYNMHLVHMH